MQIPRVAVGGFMLESNAHSPVATREEFASVCDLRGVALEADWRSEHPLAASTISGFVAAMNAAGAVGAGAAAPRAAGAPAGPSSRATSTRSSTRCARGCARRCRSTACSCRCTARPSPPSTSTPTARCSARVREVVGPAVPVLATLDLHGNIVQRMVDAASVLVAYRTNPHVDMAERGAECASLLHEMLRGMRAGGRVREAAVRSRRR